MFQYWGLALHKDKIGGDEEQLIFLKGKAQM